MGLDYRDATTTAGVVLKATGTEKVKWKQVLTKTKEDGTQETHEEEHSKEKEFFKTKVHQTTRLISTATTLTCFSPDDRVRSHADASGWQVHVSVPVSTPARLARRVRYGALLAV